MELITKAIETTGIFNAQQKILKLDESPPIAESSRVRVIILVTEERVKKDNHTVVLPQPADYVDKLAGLHKEVWQGIDTDTYLKQERDAWE